MDNLFIKIDLLEKKIQNLTRQNFELQQKIYTFEQSLNEKNDETNRLTNELKKLKIDYNDIKIGKAFNTGNKTEKNNDEAKKKIEKLIKEINLCITDLKK